MSIGMVFWAAIACIAIAAIHYRYQGEESRNKVLQAMIEKGQPVPPGLFEQQRPMDGKKLVVSGIILISLGVALLIFTVALLYSGEVDETFIPFFSAFPFCLGIACLIAARLIKRHD